jgi:MYXO-CTERM domain-containing protein
VVLVTLPVTLTAQVNNFAVSAFGKSAGNGNFSGGAAHYTLDFGSLLLGSGAVSASLFAANAAAGPADLLDGSFSIFSGAGFGLSGFTPFFDLAAGAQDPGLNVAFDPATLGSFTETIDLSGIGHNSSGYSAPVGDVFLTIDASVVGNSAVPEPPSWTVLLAGMLGLGAVAGRRLRLPWS